MEKPDHICICRTRHHIVVCIMLSLLLLHVQQCNACNNVMPCPTCPDSICHMYKGMQEHSTHDSLAKDMPFNWYNNSI